MREVEDGSFFTQWMWHGGTFLISLLLISVRFGYVCYVTPVTEAAASKKPTCLQRQLAAVGGYFLQETTDTGSAQRTDRFSSR